LAVALDPPRSWIGAVLEDHLERLFAFYGETRGVRIARKHLGWYLRTLNKGDVSDGLRQRLMGEETAAGQLRLLRTHLERVSNAA
jgi:tRNA-dihydrouridine synthase B